MYDYIYCAIMHNQAAPAVYVHLIAFTTATFFWGTDGMCSEMCHN